MLLRRKTLVNAVLMVALVGLLLSPTVMAGPSYSEAPMLKEQVSQGQLPPVTERLPENPVVVTPIEEVGQYGGTLYTIAENLKGFGTDMHVIGIEPPLRLEPDGTIGPNIFEDWATEDYQIWTFHFRKGMKWSDGAPFTANDMMFWWEDEVQNPEITELIYMEEYQGAKLEKLDDYTVRMTLAKPYPMFEYTLATQWGYLGQWFRPKHYLKQFHPNYADKDKLMEMAKAEGYDTIRALYRAKAGWSAKPVTVECPTLVPFRPVEQRLDVWVWERNPYYWKVDTEGNQLPYIDQVVVREIRDQETIQAQIVSGETDIEVWHTSLKNFPLYKSNEADGEYRTLLWQADTGAEVMFMPNLTAEDPVLAEIFQDVRFRQALSLAIDRDEINDLLYFGKAVPRQYTLHPSSIFYKEEWAKAYAEYDPARANALLDEMGLIEKDSANFRLRPDGKRLAFAIEYWPAEPETKTPICELIKDYWGAIGIDVALKPQDRSLNAQRASANQIDMNIWQGGNVIDTGWQITVKPPLPGAGDITWGNLWALWMETGGEEGQEPPAEVKRLFEIGNEFKVTVDPEKRLALGQELWQMQADNLWHIGTVGMPPYPVIVKEYLRNVPETGLWSSLWLHRYHPEQFFLKK
jgi:peptide/nickel transport system substrate-binding protein